MDGLTTNPSADFQPYLDSVVKSGEQTRAIIYVTLIVLFFIACGVRNFVYPDWQEQRLLVMTKYYNCLSGNTSAQCGELIKGYQDQGFDLTKLPQDIREKFVSSRLTELMKEDVHAETMHIPLFGVALDGNDLWLVSGVLMSILLMILAAHMERGSDNLSKARRVCPNNSCRDLLVMTHTLTLVEGSLKRPETSFRHFISLMYWVPAILNLVIVGDDIRHWYVVKSLLNSSCQTLIEFSLQVLTVVAVIYLCYRCYRLNKLFHTQLIDLSCEQFPLSA